MGTVSPEPARTVVDSWCIQHPAHPEVDLSFPSGSGITARFFHLVMVVATIYQALGAALGPLACGAGWHRQAGQLACAPLATSWGGAPYRAVDAISRAIRLSCLSRRAGDSRWAIRAIRF